MTRETVKKLAKLANNYDPYTRYIEDLDQEIQAERRNKEITEEFNKIIQSEGVDYNDGVPFELRRDMKIEDWSAEVIKWLKKKNIVIEEKPKRVWTSDEIKNLVQTNDKVLYGALRKLYACQTADEKATKEANHKNGAGFNGVDAPILTSMCEFLEKAGFLTVKQKSLARKKLAKYTKQLTVLANM